MDKISNSMPPATLEKTPIGFGVEQEHFLFRIDGLPPTQADIDRLWLSVEEEGFSPSSLSSDGKTLSLCFESAWGSSFSQDERRSGVPRSLHGDLGYARGKIR